MTKVFIITTTIYVPKALRAYASNAKRHGHADVTFVVTADKKTPLEAEHFCADLEREFGYRVAYLDVEDQIRYLESYTELFNHIPWNCIQRRTISMLFAYEHGAEVMITIDDDNHLVDEEKCDFVGEHLAALRLKEGIEVDMLSSSTGWANVCEFLSEERNIPFYARGFPMGERWKSGVSTSFHRNSIKKVMVNAGLWLEDPDVDAITRLCVPIRATAYTRPASFALERGTWSPFNSQNTAVARDVIPAYWMCPCVGRYDDIWPSYIVTAIADRLGHSIMFGLPLVRQDRNPHNYYVDFENEKMGMQTTDRFCALLRRLSGQLKGNSYQECFEELAEALKQWLTGEEAATTWKEQERSFLDGFVKSMHVWAQTIRKCDAKKK